MDLIIKLRGPNSAVLHIAAAAADQAEQTSVRFTVERIDRRAAHHTESEPIHPTELDASLDSLQLDIRTTNALKRAGINTIGQLIVRTEASLRDAKVLKGASVDRLKLALARLGLHLQPQDDATAAGAEAHLKHGPLSEPA